MAKTFTYTFADGSNLTVTTADTAQQVDAGDPGGTTYSGFPITNISGNFGGQPVTGLYGASGVYQQGNGGDVHDNAIFVSSTQGEGGSSYDGIDTNGIDFSLQNGNHINLYQSFNNQGAGATTLSYSTFNAQGAAVGNQNSSATVTQTNYNTAVCFTTGTSIRVVRAGAEMDVAVEHLVVGDLAVTAASAHKRIRWIGQRTLDLRRHPEPRFAQPVRVRAHAFAENKPSRDLRVSPGHALCLDLMGEVLIPAMALINGLTVVQEDVESVTYWHVELEDGHDILLAENMPAESYLDMGNRSFFTGAKVVDLAAAPDANPALRTHADFCRPFHADGAFVDVARAQLQRRLPTLGWRLEQPEAWDGVVLLADGRRILPKTRGMAACFELPADIRDLWLVAPTGVPQQVSGVDDSRALGLCLAAVTIDDGLGEPRAVALDDPRLDEGFHGHEGTHRWTAGQARLPAELLTGMTGTVFLRLALHAGPVRQWVAPTAVDIGATVDDTAAAPMLRLAG